MSQGAEPRVRLDPEVRKGMIRATARQVFAERGYAASGLAEIAERGQVSKTLLYHYFPDGRPELLVAVMDDVLGELLTVTRKAAGAPFNPERRLTLVVQAFLDFLQREPDAFRLLFREPWGSGEPSVVRRAVEVQVSLANELISPLAAATGAPGEALVTVTAGIIGLLLATAELVLAGQVDGATAVETASSFILGGLDRIGS